MPSLDPQCGNAQAVADQGLGRKLQSLSGMPSSRQALFASAITEKVSPPEPVIACDGPKPVRRLIRHCISKQYLKGGRWTSEPKYATNFADALEAAQACARHNLSDVELVIYLTPSCEIFTTPLTP